MFKLIVQLLKHRVTYRFLLVLAGALGYSALSDSLGGLEATLCAVLTCSD